jgi:hypothetical protein
LKGESLTYQEKLERAKEVKEKYRDVLLSIPGLKSVSVCSDGKEVYICVYISSDINSLMPDVITKELNGIKVIFRDPQRLGGVLKPRGR